jgi:hypothetical protein
LCRVFAKTRHVVLWLRLIRAPRAFAAITLRTAFVGPNIWPHIWHAARLNDHLERASVPTLLESIVCLLALLARHRLHALADALAHVPAHFFTRQRLARRKPPRRRDRPLSPDLPWLPPTFQLAMQLAGRLTAIMLHPLLEQSGMRVRESQRCAPVPHAAFSRRRFVALIRAVPHALLRRRWLPRRHDIG